MDFALTDEQKLIVDTARRFTEQELMPYEEEVERTDEVRPELVDQIDTYGSAQAVDAELLALRQGERGALVEEREREQVIALVGKERVRARVGLMQELDVLPTRALVLQVDLGTHGGGVTHGSKGMIVEQQRGPRIPLCGDDADSPRMMAETYFGGGSMHGDIALVEAALRLFLP